MSGWLRDNSPLTAVGLREAFVATSSQSAAAIGLGNTRTFIMYTDAASIAQGRAARLPSYNDYRAFVGFPRARRFEDISGDSTVAENLKKVYNTVDDVEYYVGLFAEESRPKAAVPALVGRMVGIDAFSQALTNPLLSHRVFRRETFHAVGWDSIHRTSRLADVLERNVKPGSGIATVTMDRHV